MIQYSNPITLQSLPRLCFVPIESLQLHEHFDRSRLQPLKQRMLIESVLRNPPIVASMNTHRGRYLVLDGANRVEALKSLGIPHIPAQVVDPEVPGIRLEIWNHVVWDLDPHNLLSGLLTIPNLKLKRWQSDPPYPIKSRNHLIQVILGNSEIYYRSSKSLDLKLRVRLLNAIVDSYMRRACIDRTCFQTVESLYDNYPRLGGLILYPRFSVPDIFQIASAGQKLPSGITRFIVSPRVTRINYPLAELESQKPLTKKNADLQKWVKALFSKKQVRYYPEATFVFDE